MGLSSKCAVRRAIVREGFSLVEIYPEIVTTILSTKLPRNRA
jgi:hypothetical protein